MVKLLKKLLFKAYVIFLMGFTIWYGNFMAPLVFGFEGKEEAGESLKALSHSATDQERLFADLIASKGEIKKTNLGYRVIEQPYIEGRFHHIGFEVQPDNASMCVRCHGNVPHDKSKEVRSFLNMHAFYTACETCHIRPEEGAPQWVFRWYDKETGEQSANPTALVEIEEMYAHPKDLQYPTYGNYGVKIAPGRITSGALNTKSFSFLKTQKDKAFVDHYLNEEHRLSEQQQSQMKKLVHKDINKKPIVCNQCHQEASPYLPFASLGYPPRRVNELTNTSVVGMIDKYKEFYIPSFLTPNSNDNR